MQRSAHSMRSMDAILATNQVIRNTYMLLSMSLLFSAFMAYVAMSINAPPMGLAVMLMYMGLLFLVHMFQNSALGIVFVFALTGTLGFTLGPLLNTVIHGMGNGMQLVMTALGGTGMIFLALSGYALTTRRDFSYMGGFMMAGFLTLFFVMIAGIFFQMPGVMLLVSAGFLLMSSAAILYETSQIIHGGQRNYILATVSIFVSLYNIFVSLLHILMHFNSNNR